METYSLNRGGVLSELITIGFQPLKRWNQRNLN